MDGAGRIEQCRTFYGKSSSELRRARRLYMRMIRAVVMLDGSGNKLYEHARRMRDVGLYAPLTPYKFIAHAILKQAYKTDQARALEANRIVNFTAWLRRNGWEGYGYCGYWRRGKPIPALLPRTRHVDYQFSL